MNTSTTDANCVLVRLRDVTQELTVGVGSALASVRTLSDVSLEVRASELVVLSGSRGAGERAVLAVIAGDRRGLTGSCDVSSQVRVRLMRISAQAALALAQEWQRAEAMIPTVQNVERGNASSCSDANAPGDGKCALTELFLLDVVGDADSNQPGDPSTVGASRRGPGRVSRVSESFSGAPRPWNESNRATLLAWAAACRQRGGAVVMAAGESLGHGLFDNALTQMRWAAEREPGIPMAVREIRVAPSSVRVVAMHCGRLAALIPMRARDLAS